jgi:3-methyladenine DNA glycosylase AlkC
VAKKPQFQGWAFQAWSKNKRNQRWKITATAPEVAS